MGMQMTQANWKQVTLTQEEADARRAYNEKMKNRKARIQTIPQHVLDYLLPMVEVVSYVDDEGTALGECWLWNGLMDDKGRTPRGRIDGVRFNVRRWVAQQLRQLPIPAKWVTLADCGNERCVHPHCAHPMGRSKAGPVWAKRIRLTEDLLRAKVASARSTSPMTPESVQRMRDERAASVAAGRPITYVELGRRYGVSWSTAAGICSGRRWPPGQLQQRVRPPASVFDLGRMA